MILLYLKISLSGKNASDFIDFTHIKNNPVVQSKYVLNTSSHTEIGIALRSEKSKYKLIKLP